MSPAAFTALGALGTALIVAVGSTVAFLVQHRRLTQNEHLQRAFEKHLDSYERIFVSARTAQDTLRNYITISMKVEDRSDPFLRQLLAIAENACHDYCTSVTWSHNPAMLYLDKRLEERCLGARDLLLAWLAVRRVSAGDVPFLRSGNQLERLPVRAVRSLKLGDYRELRVETRLIVLKPANERRRSRAIDRSLSQVIAQLKKVMAY
jgi:hypothetical protein